MSSYPESMKMADQNSKNISQGQIDIFGFSEEDSKKIPRAYNNTVNTAIETSFSSLIITSYNIIDIIKS